MADEVNLTGDPPRAIHSNGQFPGQCVDVIDLGDNPEPGFKGKPPKIQRKIVVVWVTGEVNPDTGRPFEVRKEYAFSMYETAGIRLMLESWRGKPFTDEDIENTVPLHKMVGAWCMLTIAHAKSKKGRLYAKLMSVTGLHKDVRRPELPKYERDDFWAGKKNEYAEAAATFRKANTPDKRQDESFSDFPAELDGEDDDLPF